MKKLTQGKEILKYMKAGNSITPMEALRRFGCFRLAARCFDIRRMGHSISKTMMTVNGSTFARYRLVK